MKISVGDSGFRHPLAQRIWNVAETKEPATLLSYHNKYGKRENLINNVRFMIETQIWRLISVSKIPFYSCMSPQCFKVFSVISALNICKKRNINLFFVNFFLLIQLIVGISVSVEYYMHFMFSECMFIQIRINARKGTQAPTYLSKIANYLSAK